MNILFLSISALPHMSKHTISLDLLREFRRNGHNVYVVAAVDRKSGDGTHMADEDGCTVLRVKIGANKKTNPIVKGITTIMLPKRYITSIKQYFADVRFDLVLYTTPPITHAKTVEFIKKRDGAKSYLLLKDIFPQNAVDIGMMSEKGIKGLLYRYFRAKEKKLYALSDRIGCMSQANVDYLLEHNPQVSPEKVEICPNSIEPQDMSVTPEERIAMRNKYGIPTDKMVFVYGGNLGKPQGIPFLMDCLRSNTDNQDAYFLIVGDGTEYKKLETFVNTECPANTKLMSKLPKEDYDRLVAACNVGMIFLDHRFTIPNFPSRLLAYMQAGLPVLACTDLHSDIGKVITEGGFGWWCESNDAQEFTKLVAQICRDDHADMSQKIQAYLMDHYTAEKAYKTIAEAMNLSKC